MSFQLFKSQYIRVQEALSMIGTRSCTITLKRAQRSIPFRIKYVCRSVFTRSMRHPKWITRFEKQWISFVQFYELRKGDVYTFRRSTIDPTTFFV